MQVADQGSWVRNCALKGIFMEQAMRILAQPLLWIDADATLERVPTQLRGIGVDFGVYAFSGPRRRSCCGRVVNLPDEFPDPPKWFNSGTVFVNNTKGGVLLLERWAELCRQDDGQWDQWLLQQAWTDVRPSTFWMPQSYCAINGRCNDNHGRPVVSHKLASAMQKVDRG
jgi:hypothetical protein